MQASETFTSETHYKWSPRDLTSWCKNLGNYKINNFESIIHVSFLNLLTTSESIIFFDMHYIYDYLFLKLLFQVIYEEAVCIFRDRLVSDDDRRIFDLISLKFLGSNSMLEHYFMPVINQRGIFRELIDRENWTLLINKIINQCSE